MAATGPPQPDARCSSYQVLYQLSYSSRSTAESLAVYAPASTSSATRAKPKLSHERPSTAGLGGSQACPPGYPDDMPGGTEHDRNWTFVTNHFLVLLCIAEDPGIRMADVAKRIGVTERAVQGIVGDLEKAGYLQRSRVGRRNHYEIHNEMPLRPLQTQHKQLGDLLSLIARN